jgi:exodeoxyribonuclease V beta subunit
VSYRRLDTEAVLDFPLTGMRLIEASAGTGKTYTIANLYLRHIVAGRELGQVLVVTFTTAATDELRGRIRARLFETLELLGRDRESDDPFLAALVAQIREGGEKDLAARRLRLAVRAMDEAAVYTIHSFCQRALSELAFHSGQPFRLEVLTDDRELWRQAIQDWWRRTTYPLDAARLRLLNAAVGDLEAFRQLLEPLLGPQRRRLLPEAGDLASLLDRGDTLGSAIRSLGARWRADGERLKGILRGSRALSRAQKSAYRPDRLDGALQVVDDRLGSGESSLPPEVFDVLTAGCIARHRLKKPDPELDDPFFADCEDLSLDLQRLERDLRAAALAEAADSARRQVRAGKDAAQRLSFDDLLTEMQAALTGPGADALAAALRQQFPVAMIDEFQDTDPVQYGIFRRLYQGWGEGGLIMIGDPKQAIYGFRGGDIFTYMEAKSDVGVESVYTLETNWRSTPQVVKAVNALFGNRPRDAFVYGSAIPFAPVEAARREHRPLSEDGRTRPALTLWTLPVAHSDSGAAKTLSKEDARALTHATVAGEIARLIEAGRRGRARIGDRPLAPGDIAVLVRGAFEAAELREVLAERGVHAVSVSRDGVFASAEASALQMLLAAIQTPRDRDCARLALTCPLLAKDYVEVDRILRSEQAWADWVDALLTLHETWQRRGFMAMFQRMLRVMGVAESLSREPRAERRLTNLLHLGELLQQAAKGHAGMDALLVWLRRQREEPATDEAELRLESDEALVQIVTIHASKGLEYPVVLVPYLWGCKPRTTKGLLAFHRDGEPCLDAGSDALDDHLRLAERERLAEDLRLAYVALTRAESALYLVWGRAGTRDGHAGQTALGYLLHPHQQSSRLVAELPDAFAGLTDITPDLERLASAADGEILIAPLPESADADGTIATAPPAVPLARRFRGRIATDWRISSFSALTRQTHAVPTAIRDETAPDPGLRFPAGSDAGSYLHLLLEELDFEGDVAAQVLVHSARIAPRFGLDHDRWGRDAATLLERVTRTALDGTGLRLAGIGGRRRLNELEFDLSTGAVDVPALNRLLCEMAAEPPPVLPIATFRGIVNGVIDLVFAYRGRYFIADYKSNFLGGRFDDYDAAKLGAAVRERRYDLQYLLYTLALHRYLGRRLPGYDYERHFGGVLYLFLRAMRPETGPRCGVFFDRPAPEVIATLDQQVFPQATPDRR